MDKHYIITSKKGIYIARSDSVTTIGQVPGCDILIANYSQYEDVLFARIIPDKDGRGWHLVRCTRHYPILVNGNELNRVHYLRDGDRLEFPGGAFTFYIRKGERKTPEVIHVHRHGKLLWGVMIALLLIMASLGYLYYDRQRELLTDDMRAEISESVYTLRVDSLQLLKSDSVVESYSYASAPTATAFLTADSLIVTARHCVEPWLNMVRPADYAKIAGMPDWAVAKALFAETENRLSDSDSWRIRSFMTLTDEKGHSFTLSSDDFKINRDLDEIVEAGDYNTTKFWRSISHRYTREDMMLGDVAVAHYSRGGGIELASEEELRELLKPGVRLTFAGHPESAVEGNRLDFKSDELHTPLRDTRGHPGRIFVLAHDGALIRGFSGGPVLIRDGMGYKAAGVISVTDSRNENRSYSVPSSEIKRLR